MKKRRKDRQKHTRGTHISRAKSARCGDRGLGGGMWFSATAGDGRDDKYFVAVFETVFVVAEKADVFFVDVEIAEAPNLTMVVAQVWVERGKAGLDFGDQLGQIPGRGLDFPGTVGVFLKS